MKRTDKEIVSAMEYIKSQHNGELPYVFGTFDCAKMMAKYLLKQSSITAVVQAKPENCDHEWRVDSFDHFGFPLEQYCENCDEREAI